MSDQNNMQDHILQIRILCAETSKDIKSMSTQIDEIKNNFEKEITELKKNLKELSDKHQKLSDAYSYIKSGAVIILVVGAAIWAVVELCVNHYWR